MSEDWKIGDLAVCVKGGVSFTKSGIFEGTTYRVIGVVVGTSKGRTEPGLMLAGIILPPGKIGILASAFRKIRPDEHEGEREDWQLLLDSMKRKVRA